MYECETPYPPQKVSPSIRIHCYVALPLPPALFGLRGMSIFQCRNVVYLFVKLCDPISRPKDGPFHQNLLTAAHSSYSSGI